MYTYVAKNLITVAIYKCVLKSLRLSQRDSMCMLQEPAIFCNLHSTYDSPCSSRFAEHKQSHRH